MVRTPEERFAGLPDFPYEARHAEWERLRLAYLDEGDPGAPVVVLFRGEPTWSFLWRKVIPPLVAAGLRCVAPDLPGFGRWDKPIELGWYSYDRQVAAMTALLSTSAARPSSCTTGAVRSACASRWSGQSAARASSPWTRACSRAASG